MGVEMGMEMGRRRWRRWRLWLGVDKTGCGGVDGSLWWLCGWCSVEEVVVVVVAAVMEGGGGGGGGGRRLWWW
ncbi:hypothetical protein Hanom_Chr03g00234441 [Helianthus anomalus]